MTRRNPGPGGTVLPSGTSTQDTGMGPGRPRDGDHGSRPGDSLMEEKPRPNSHTQGPNRKKLLEDESGRCVCGKGS